MCDENQKTSAAWRSEVVANSWDVEKYNFLGYRTIEIREEDAFRAQTLTENVVLPGSNYTTSVSKTVGAVERSLKFFMVKDGDSVVADLHAKIATLEDARAKDAAAATTLTKENTALAEMSKTLKLDIERRRVEQEREQRVIEEQRTRLQKMEGDIAKFRKEIGEERWRTLTDPQSMMPSKSDRNA